MPGNRPSFANSALRTTSTSTWSGNNASLSFATISCRRGLRTYVLGVSGGVDSSTAGRLAQLAVERLRARGYEARFAAVRLPYGSQRDEEDAALALEFVRPEETFTVNIKDPSDAMLFSLKRGNVQYVDDFQEDFVLGNIRARQRMIAQYAIAGARAHPICIHLANRESGFEITL
jgi:NAD+ synthetase